jgi:peptide/nickel transport system permease protein
MAEPITLGEDVDRKRAGFWRLLWHRNKVGFLAGVILVAIALLAICAPLVATGDPTDMSPVDRLRSPSEVRPMGTDVFGRSVWSRIVFGARVSLTVGVVSVLAAALLGTLVGLVAGYLGRWQEYVTMRLMDVLFSFPSILLAILIVTIWGAGFHSVVTAIVLIQLPIFGRIVRGSTLSLKHVEFVQASVASGASTWRVLFRHVLPNVAGPILVQLALSMGGAIIIEAALSYLGLGAVPPTPSLGSMLSENRTAMELAPWTVLYPGLALALLVLSINMFGDAVRDLLDPRLRSAMGG